VENGIASAQSGVEAGLEDRGVVAGLRLGLANLLVIAQPQLIGEQQQHPQQQAAEPDQQHPPLTAIDGMRCPLTHGPILQDFVSEGKKVGARQRLVAAVGCVLLPMAQRPKPTPIARLTKPAAQPAGSVRPKRSSAMPKARGPMHPPAKPTAE
jgi:hypothetical protein